jgi:hypothetical protein
MQSEFTRNFDSVINRLTLDGIDKMPLSPLYLNRLAGFNLVGERERNNWMKLLQV